VAHGNSDFVTLSVQSNPGLIVSVVLPTGVTTAKQEHRSSPRKAITTQKKMSAKENAQKNQAKAFSA
jgi:hypothetical protein